MASRKLTALPTATEVTTSDKIYIVDVSDTTESPQGTSKQALISELPSSGITSLTSTDGSIDIDNTDPDAPDLSIPSGEWTPIISEITSGATVDATSAFYSKGGTVVNFSIGLDVQLDAAQLSTTFKISLPVASDFANARQLLLSCNLLTNLTYCVGSSSSSDNLISMDVIGTANGDAITGLQITGQYLIV